MCYTYMAVYFKGTFSYIFLSPILGGVPTKKPPRKKASLEKAFLGKASLQKASLNLAFLFYFF